MSEIFDPYYEWLGIPAGEQPPNHYRLLGVTALESSESVIQNAANQRMVYLRTFQLGKHADESQRLLNEVAKAKVCLLRPEKKAAYDETLRRQLAPSGGAADASKPDSIPKALVKASPLPLVVATGSGGVQSGAKLRDMIRQPKPSVLAGLAAVVVAIGSVCAWFAFARGGGNGDRADNSAPSASLTDTPRPQSAVTAASSAKPAPSTTASVAIAGGAPKRDSKVSKREPVKSKSEDKQASGGISARPSNVPPSLVAEISPTEHAHSAEPKAAPKGLVTETHQANHETNIEKVVPKRPPPSGDDQARFVKDIDEVYRPQDAKGSAALTALARKLLDLGEKDKTKPVEQFVLLRRASEIARDAGEAELMLDAVDAISDAGFDIRANQIKARLFMRLFEQGIAGGASHEKLVCAACLAFADDAAAERDFSEAIEVLDAAFKYFAVQEKQAQATYFRFSAMRPRKGAEKAERDKKVAEAKAELDALTPALAALDAHAKRLRQALRDDETLQAAEKRLKASPDDPDACLAIGRWHCFHEDDWDQGLKFLAKGSNPGLKALALDELSDKPSDAKQRVARGDAWWDAAEKADEGTKFGMLRRFEYWYRKALPDLPQGLVKLKVENRLAQADKELAAASANGSAAIPNQKRPAGPSRRRSLTIVSASFGGGSNWANVTARVQEIVDAGGDIWANPGTLKADPTPGWRKQLKVVYRKYGQEKTIWVGEDGRLDSPDFKR